MKKIFNYIAFAILAMTTQTTKAFGHGGDEEYIPSESTYSEIETGSSISDYLIYIVPVTLLSVALISFFVYKKFKK